MFLWVDLNGPSSTQVSHAARARGVRIPPGTRFSISRTHDRYLRVPYTCPPQVLSEAIDRIAAAAGEAGGRSRGHRLTGLDDLTALDVAGGRHVGRGATPRPGHGLLSNRCSAASGRKDLDDAQRAAVVHGTGPLIVLAGAGTGKTRVLTSRVASLVERGAPAEKILLLTFTRRAAADMTARAAQLGRDRAAASRVWGGTFHAVAHRLVAEHAEQLGLSAVSVLDAGDVVDLLDLIRDEHGLTGTETRLPSGQTLADVYTRAVNNNRPVRAVLAADFPAWAWCADRIVAVLSAFVARKRARGPARLR